MPDQSGDQRPLAVETINLRKVYGRKVAVEGLTLTVTCGEVFGFLGPNGAGKTTVVKILMGLVYPTAGTARLLGEPIGNVAAKRRIGFLPELFRFPDWLRADELLDFHGQLAGLERHERRRRIVEVLDLVGLSSRANDRLRTFSKGMLQRIGLAQAILADPDVVFLDEPTSALDPLGRREVRDIIRHLKQQGKTVFLNSHLLSEIELVCDRVAIIDRGHVVSEGSLQKLLERQEVEVRVEAPTEALFQALASRYQVLHRDGSLLTLRVENRDRIPEIADLVVRSGARLYGLSARRTSLEDLFAEVVERGSD
ncbi:MAG: ABC transporter ATP-binding protein [Chloroflexota bacterium]